jgi:polyhydroxyalkanoate synthesis regulator phasin
MAQLRRGARQALDYLYADLDDAERYAPDNPAAVRKLVRRIKERLQEEIEPMLQRAEQPSLEQRVKALEEKIEELTAGNVTKFKREA